MIVYRYKNAPPDEPPSGGANRVGEIMKKSTLGFPTMTTNSL